MFNGHAPLMSGLFLLNLDCSGTHIHNIEAKRCEVDNDSACYLWPCHLGHIAVKCMKKLHADGLLESLDYESFDACEPCLMDKMTKTPFSRTMERANDLLEIIHVHASGITNLNTNILTKPQFIWCCLNVFLVGALFNVNGDVSNA